MVAGGPGSRWRARTLRTTSAEWTPWVIASAQAASTAGSPSLSTAVRMSTICRLPSLTPASLADHNAVGIGVNLDRTPDRAGCHRVFVIVEANQAGLRDRRRHRVEAVEPAGIRNELRPFRLEHLPDRLIGQLRMAVRLGVSDALVE